MYKFYCSSKMNKWQTPNDKYLTPGRVKWTWILLAIFATLQHLQQQLHFAKTSTQYEIQPLRNNAGLSYAKVEPLRITSTYCRIVVYMDPQYQ